MDKQERYYNIFKLNRVFAISSILFLILLIWTFADDYDRTWKTHQSEFRQIEIAFNDSLLKLEESRILESEEYKIALATLKSTEESLAEKDEDLKRLQNELSSHEEDKFATSMEYNAVKAEYDVAKYLHEEAVSKGHGDPEETGSNLEQLEASLLQHRLRLEETERNFKEVEDQINFLEADKSTAQNEVSRIERKADILKLKLQKVDPESMTFGNRLGNAVRDLPVLDFLAPYYKIDQIVIKDITEDLNFANVPKVDRCTTCHMGIATSGYENSNSNFSYSSFWILHFSYNPSKMRCRCASNKITALATDTFKLSTIPCMETLISPSTQSKVSFEIPSNSAPNTIAVGLV